MSRARDAAEERERAAAAANRSKSQFLTMMSHEFRTPLNGVLGMAQAMSHEGLAPAQNERLKVIRRSGENLLSIINDLLDLSKIEANSFELGVAEFDLEHMVRGVGAAFAPVAERKGLSFELAVEAGARGHYLGDAACIRRVLYCLVENAVKFTESGVVKLTVEEAEGQLLFHVSDTGIGICQTDQSQLFDVFYQVEATVRRRFGGAGLGLALSHQMTERMRGELTVVSRAGEGSTFTVRLPLSRTDAQAWREPSERSFQINDATQLRVLAAEDNPTNQLVLKTLLMQAGISPTFVADGHAALEAWESQDWDIILMDIQMPEMDGETAARAIRDCEARTGRRRTPIVAVTANAMVDQVVRYKLVGIDAIVPKPIDLRQLLGEIDAALGQAEPSRHQDRVQAG